MTIQFVEEFDNASKTARFKRNSIYKYIDSYQLHNCIPFTFGTSLFGLLAVPIYAALQSIANETYRTRLFTKFKLRLLRKEGLFNPRNNPIRKRVRSAPFMTKNL